MLSTFVKTNKHTHRDTCMYGRKRHTLSIIGTVLPRIALSITVFYYLIQVYHKRVLLVFYKPYKKDVFPMYLEYLYGFLILLYNTRCLINMLKKNKTIHTPLQPPTKETLPFSQTDRSKISGFSYFFPWI